MVWPTSAREFKKPPVISFIIPEENVVKTGDRVIGFKNKSGDDRIYLITEIQSTKSSTKASYKQVKASVSLIR